MASEKEPGGEPPAADERLSIWERLEHPTPAPRASLTHGQIGAAAVEIADAEGLDCVSIRRLAGRLGVAPMALYRYVSSKEEIFELMVDAVHAGGADFEAASGDWRAVMRAAAHGTRAIMLRHPWLGRVSSQAVTVLTPNQLASAERALAALDGLGLDADTMMAIFDTVIAYARGATAREVVLLEIMKREGWQTGDDVRDALAPHMIWLMSTGRYPTFERWAREAKRKDDAEWRFDFGLECVLNGIAAQLSI
ncbi:MAG: TetR family transcriptional regulator [Actinomycetia bacterium]|nr:TetR family transcriptional regulator [Actinomycetes bacterium]